MSYGDQNFHAELKEIYNWCCAWCGDARNARHRGAASQLCVDHVHSSYSGGSQHDPENFQILCRRCNSIKGAYTLPRLAPRQPAVSAYAVLARQEYLKHRIMPSRRLNAEGPDYPTRSELGY